MATIVLPDTSLLWNFCQIERLDLLRRFCEHVTPTWAADVYEECDSKGLDCEALRAIFGEPIYPTPEQEHHAIRIRAKFFSGQMNMGVGYLGQDRGECVTLAIWSDRGDDADLLIILSEDQSVIRFCQRSRDDCTEESREMRGRKLIPMTTEDVLDWIIRQDLKLSAPSKPMPPAAFNSVAKGRIQQDLIRANRPWLGPAYRVAARPEN